MFKFAKRIITLALAAALVAPATPAFAVDIPVNTVAPTLTGSMAAFRTSTVTAGIWTATGSVTLTYAWYYCNTAVPAAIDTVPAGCTALPTTNGWSTVAGSSVNMSFGTNLISLYFGTALPAGLVGKFLAVKEIATTATDTAFKVTANSEPLAAAAGRPTLTTNAASIVSDTTATVSGTYTGNNTDATFRCYRATTSAMTTGTLTNGYYGDALSGASSFNATQAPTTGYGTATITGTCAFTSLTAGTTYYYQFIGDTYPQYGNTDGRYAMGPVMSFTTKNVATFQTTGSSSGAAPTDTTKYAPTVDSITLPGQGTLLKTGSSFVGWSYGGTTYKEGETMVAPLGGWYFTPVWVSGNSLTYLANGATGTVPVESASPFSGAGSAAAKDGSSLTKQGYTFSGWNSKADGTGTAFAVGATVAVSSQVKLYAQWQVASSAPTPPPPAVAPIISGFSTRVVPSNTATSISLAGINMATVSSVVISSLTGAATSVNATVVSSNASQLVIQTPTLSPGTYSIQITNAQGIMTFTNAFVVIAQSSSQGSSGNEGSGALISKTSVSGFLAGVATLTNAQKAKLKSIARTGSVKSITCVGYTQGPTALAVDTLLSLNRAKNTCAALKQIFGDKISYQNYGKSDSRVGNNIRRVEIELRK